MSDDVKRYDLELSEYAGIQTLGYKIHSGGEHVLASNHDRVVAELRAELAEAKERLDVFKNREYEARTVEELREELDQKGSELLRRESELETARRVISKLTEQRNWALTELGQYPEQMMASDDAEIAAIEAGTK